ncbi:hypothetical protein MRX96_022903 [Rhipicephalus microplus]
MARFPGALDHLRRRRQLGSRAEQQVNVAPTGCAEKGGVGLADKNVSHLRVLRRQAYGAKTRVSSQLTRVCTASQGNTT